MISRERRRQQQPPPHWLWKWTSRRGLGAFLGLFLAAETLLFVVHEVWLLPLPESPPEMHVERRITNMNARIAQRSVATNKNNGFHRVGAVSQTQHQLHAPLHFVSKHQTSPTDKIMGKSSTTAMVSHLARPKAVVAQQIKGGVSPNKNPTVIKTNKKTHQKTTASNKKMAMKMTAKGTEKGIQKPRGWDPGDQGRNQTPTPLKVPTPIFVASLPKSGTTSIWQYFQCGARSAAHQWVKTVDGQSMQLGLCLRHNLMAGHAPLEGCGDYDVYADTGFANFVSEGISDCFYPSINALPQLYQHYPNATIILIKRNATAWLQSMEAWGNGSLLLRWRNCNLTKHVPNANPNEPSAFATFYEWHTQHVRSFAHARPSLTYIEVELESPTAGQQLEEQIGIAASCWGKCTPASKFCEHVS